MGGQFIPSEVLASATAEEKAALAGGGDGKPAKPKPPEELTRSEFVNPDHEKEHAALVEKFRKMAEDLAKKHAKKAEPKPESKTKAAPEIAGKAFDFYESIPANHGKLSDEQIQTESEKVLELSPSQLNDLAKKMGIGELRKYKEAKALEDRQAIVREEFLDRKHRIIRAAEE